MAGGLEKKSRRPRVDRSATNQGIVFAGQNNHPRRGRKSLQPRLHLEAVHGGHSNIKDYHSWMMNLSVPQECDWICKRFHIPTRKGK